MTSRIFLQSQADLAYLSLIGLEFTKAQEKAVARSDSTTLGKANWVFKRGTDGKVLGFSLR
jgi:hypothetical protein